MYFDGSSTVSLSDFHLPMIGVGSTGLLPPNLPMGSDLPFSFDITSQFRSLLASGEQNFGFQLGAGSPDVGVAIWGNSSSDPSRRPYIVLSTVPEPSILMMLALVAGVVGVVAVPRRLSFSRHL
jgi:hypothetical protein